MTYKIWQPLKYTSTVVSVVDGLDSGWQAYPVYQRILWMQYVCFYVS